MVERFFLVSERVLVAAAAFGNEFVNDVTRDFLEAARLHGVGGAARGKGANVGGVAEHF